MARLVFCSLLILVFVTSFAMPSPLIARPPAAPGATPLSAATGPDDIATSPGGEAHDAKAGPRTDGNTTSTAPTADDEAAPADSTTAFPKKMPGHTTWEKVAAAPGYLIYLPLWAAFTVTGGTIKYVEKTGIIGRTQELVTFDDGRGGIYPAYSGRSGAGLSFFLKNYVNEGFRFDATASYGFYDRSLFRLRYRRLEIFNGALITGLNLQYHNMTDERFFGIGPDAPKSPQTNFRQEQALADLTLGRRITDDIDINLIGGIEYNMATDSRNGTFTPAIDIYPELGAAGWGTDVNFGHVDLRGVWDGRRNLGFRPLGGFLAFVDGSVYEDIGRDRFGYTQVLVEYRQFIRLWHSRVLVLRANGWFADPLNNRAIPFYALPEHGEDETVRGYARGRWRDRDAVLASAEYRWAIWRTIDALLFTDASQVAENIFNDFDTNNIKWSYGGGFRLYSAPIRRGQTDFGSGVWLIFAQGEDGFRVHFRWN